MTAVVLGEKISQSQMFDEQGQRVPVTSIRTSPCFLVDLRWSRSNNRDYCTFKLGFGQSKRIAKTVQGQLKKAGIEPPLRFLKEVRVNSVVTSCSPVEEEGKKGVLIGETKVFIGGELKPSVLFKVGEKVRVTGVSKGKGFQGVVKRHHFAGGPRTHGQSDRERAPGSMGQTTTPGRTYKGKRMAGRMGNERVTVRGLRIMKAEDQSLAVKGLIPGHIHTLVEVVSDKR